MPGRDRPRSGPGATAGRTPDVRERILEATYACIARWGLAKTTVGDAAREAGVSRATVYRYFPGGRDELVEGVVAWELGRFLDRLYEAVGSAGSLEEVMERAVVFAHRAIADHEVLQRVLGAEPELLLPTLTVESTGTERMLARFLAPYLSVHQLAPGIDVEESADFLARMLLSYVSSPGRWDLGDPDQVARLVRAELLGGIVPRSTG